MARAVGANYTPMGVVTWNGEDFECHHTLPEGATEVAREDLPSLFPKADNATISKLINRIAGRPVVSYQLMRVAPAWSLLWHYICKLQPSGEPPPQLPVLPKREPKLKLEAGRRGAHAFRVDYVPGRIEARDRAYLGLRKLLRLIVEALVRGGKPVYTREELIELLQSDERVCEAAHRQHPWDVFQQGRAQLQRQGFITPLGRNGDEFKVREVIPRHREVA